MTGDDRTATSQNGAAARQSVLEAQNHMLIGPASRPPINTGRASAFWDTRSFVAFMKASKKGTKQALRDFLAQNARGVDRYLGRPVPRDSELKRERRRGVAGPLPAPPQRRPW